MHGIVTKLHPQLECFANKRNAVITEKFSASVAYYPHHVAIVYATEKPASRKIIVYSLQVHYAGAAVLVVLKTS